MAVIEATDHQPEPESYATGASRALIPGRRTSSFAGVSTIDGPKPEDGSCGGGLVDAVCFPRSPQPVSPVSGSASPTSSPVPVEGCQHHPQQHHQGHHQGHHQHHCHPHPDHQADQQHPLRQNPPEHQILTSTNTLTTFTNLTDTLTNNNLNHNNHNNPNQNPNTHPNTNPNPNLHSLTRIPTVLQPPLPWHTRLHHFTFAWYAVTLSTSGIALTLSLIPKRFPGLSEIGLGIFLLDLLFFLFITLAITLRFTLHGRETLKRAFTRPGEALFVPTFSLSLAAILLNVGEYGRVFLSGGGDVMGGGNGGSGEGGGNGGAMRIGGPMARFMEVAFWTYLALTFGSSVVQYHLLFAVKEERRLMISSMTPAWILPIFPVMLAGSLAGSAARGLEAGRALGVLAAGLAAQGLGILFSVFFYATYLGRLMAFGLPAQRPGMFIAVGPPSFTCASFVSMAGQMPRIFAELSGPDKSGTVGGILVSDLTGRGDVATLAAGIRLIAIVAAVFLWGLSFWFFTSAMLAVAVGMPDRRFHLSWWSFVFPNVGFVIASIRIGNAVGNQGILWVSTVMTAGLFVAWLFIAFRCVRAVYRREIVWPGHDEDEC